MLKKCLCLFLLMILLLSCTACQGISAKEKTVTLTDQAGRNAEVPVNPERIVSGYYISTSVLLALGVKDRLVGMEAKAETRPIYALAAPELLSLPNVGSAKSFDSEGCAALEPQLVILPMKLKEQAEVLQTLGIAVLLVNPEDEASLSEMITLLSKATGTEKQGEKLLSSMQESKDRLKSALSDTSRPTVYMTGNSDLLSTCGSAMYQSALIEAAGGENVAETLPDTYWANVSYEQLLAWDPDFIILSSDAVFSVEDVLSDPALASCTAVQNGRVYRMPGDIEALDSPVPGSVWGSLWLASVLHPDKVTQEDYETGLRAFYQEYYGFTIEK